MAEFLIGTTIFLLIVTGATLARLLLGRSSADRLMAVQLLGTGGSAICMLLAIVGDKSEIIDVALTLALLAAFAVAAFSLPSRRPADISREGPDHVG